MTGRRLLVYGATGYTGRLCVESLIRRGIRPVVAGRNEPLVRDLAGPLGLEWRAFTLDDPDEMARGLAGMTAVLHAAGPFETTWGAMFDACLRSRVHYMDLTAEISVLEGLAARDEEAKSRGIVALPAVGHAVVPTDCLAAIVARTLPSATTLRIAIGGSALDALSRGSTKALIEHAGEPPLVRRAGRLETLGARLERNFDFGYASRPAVAVRWADLVTAHHTTGIDDIEVYFEAAVPLRAMMVANRTLGRMLQSDAARNVMDAQSRLVPFGPSADDRLSRRCILVAEAEDRTGRRAVARLIVPEVYAASAECAAIVSESLLGSTPAPGFRTPAGLFGPDLVQRVPGVLLQSFPAVAA